MKKRNFKRFLYTLLILFVLFIGFFLWSNNELNKVFGKSTEVVNISSIIKTSLSTFIRNTNVLSEDCSHFIENQDVIVKNGKIIHIGKNLIIESNSRIIDGTNKYLIPGLIDSHVHLKESKNDLYLYLANGVTYVREMAGRPIVLEWRKSIQGNGIGPRMFIASPPIYSSESGLTGYYYAWTRQAINYSNKNDARKTIKKLNEQGYNAIKMYNSVNPKIFKATIEIANEYNLPVIGHIPNINLGTLYKSGQKEVAHIEELVSKNMEEFDKSITRNPEEYLEFLKSHADHIAKKLKKNNIYVTSTISLSESIESQKNDLQSQLKKVELRYVNPKILEGTVLHKLGWLPNENVYEYDGEDNAEARKLSLSFWNTYVEAVHIMTKVLIDNEVPIMAGTDANTATNVPGFSMHSELESLTKSGMSNSQVLYSATVAPSEWMKSKTGKIRVGYNSDLVLLSKNPLENIKNTKTIEYVFFNNHLIDKTQIKNILKAIENANNKNRNADITDFVN